MPSTVEASEEFAISAVSQEKVWSYLTNLANIGSCIPGCESVSKIDSNTAIFRIKLKVGYLSRTFEIKARLKDVFPPDRVTFFGEGSDAEVTGNLELKDQSAGVSVKYRIEIRPVSVIGKTAIAMIGKDLVKKQASEFASCVKAKLENSA
jgi:carbon monoxide dehydrogenase subunit G